MSETAPKFKIVTGFEQTGAFIGTVSGLGSAAIIEKELNMPHKHAEAKLNKVYDHLNDVYITEGVMGRMSKATKHDFRGTENKLIAQIDKMSRHEPSKISGKAEAGLFIGLPVLLALGLVGVTQAVRRKAFNRERLAQVKAEEAEFEARIQDEVSVLDDSWRIARWLKD